MVYQRAHEVLQPPVGLNLSSEFYE